MWGPVSSAEADGKSYCVRLQPEVCVQDEIRLLTQIREGDAEDKRCCCRLLDTFEHNGPHGRHVCMLFEVLGDNLLALIKRYKYRGIPLPVVRNISRQVLVGLDYMHR